MEAVTANAAASGGVAPAQRRSPTFCRWRWSATGPPRRNATRSASRGSTSPTRSSARLCARSPSGWWTWASSPATRWPSWPTPARSGPMRASGSSPRAGRSSPSTRPTPPRSASTCWPTRTRRPCSSRTPPSSRRCARSRSDCPALSHVVVMDPAGAELDDELSLDALRERGRTRDEAEWRRRYEAVGPDDICLFIYTSGTTGPPKGCLLSHGNYRSITNAAVKNSVLDDGDSAYLFLPLAHAFAILIQFVVFDLGTTLAYWSRDPKQIIADLAAGPAHLLPVGAADLREDLHDGHARGPRPREARPGGGARREGAPGARRRASRCRPSLQTAFDAAEEALYKNVRAPVRRPHTRVRDRRRADRPRDPALLLRLRRAGDGGLRHDRDRHQRHREPHHRRRLPLRLGRQAARRRGGQDRRRRRGAGQGPEHLPGLLQERRRHRRRRWRTAGSTPATSAASTRTASSTSPAARRTSSSPRAARTSRPPTWRTA